jgi:hypothetical protein
MKSQSNESLCAIFNQYQEDWMNLLPTESGEKVSRISDNLRKCPRSHISQTEHGYSVIWQGQPVCASLETFDLALFVAGKHKIQTDFMWDGFKGGWKTI